VEEVLLIVVVVLGSALAIAVASIVAFRRTTEHRRQLEGLRAELNTASDRLAAIERWIAGARATKSPAPASAPAPAPEPAQTVRPAPEPPRPEPPRPVPPPPIIEPRPIPAAVTPIEIETVETVEVVEIAVVQAEPARRNPVIEWLLQGNPLAKLAIVLLFLGLAFLLQLANERGMLPIELRLSGAAVIAMGLLAVGWRLRHRKPVYALTLQGGAIGALYLTSFAAFRVYSLLPHSVVFGLLIVICAASVALAVLQSAQSLALLASLGGYLAPVLLSTGGGNHVALFSYYAVLSLGILAISIWKAWRPLNLIGFAFSFGIGAMWGAENYQPSHYASAQFFLALNLVIYGVLAVLMALRRADSTQGALVDGTLAFGAPLVGFGLQVGLTQHWEYGPAFSALGFGALYLPLAWFTMKRWPERGRRMTLSFLALGAGFVTLAIPLALSARWTSMAWALEGAGVLWAGRTQRNRRMTWSGTLLLGLAAASAWNAVLDGVDTPTFLMLSATLSLAWLFGARLWSRMDDGDEQKWVSVALLTGSMIAWVILVIGGSDRLDGPEGHKGMLALIWMSASALVWLVAGNRLQWPALVRCSALAWPAATLGIPVQMFAYEHPFGSGWWSVGWPIALVAMWQVLRLSKAAIPAGGQRILHGWFVWIAFALSATEVFWRLDGSGWGAEEWPVAGVLTVCAAFVLAVSALSRGRHWAVTAHPKTYWFGGLIPVVITAGLILLQANVLDGRVPELPYIPLLNVLEEPVIFVLLMGAVWQRALKQQVAPSVASLVRNVLVVFVVWWANGMLLRTLAMNAGIGWSFDALWDSAFIQTSMALAWTVGALVCMTVAARTANRSVWFAGAAGLGVVVVKLMVVDSARGSGLARAIAFIGVALLILLIGYLAPLPPRQKAEVGSEGAAS